jgi:hypothetical protein
MRLSYFALGPTYSRNGENLVAFWVSAQERNEASIRRPRRTEVDSGVVGQLHGCACTDQFHENVEIVADSAVPGIRDLFAIR